MSLEKIIDKINSDAIQKAEEILVEAKKRAEEIQKKAIDDGKQKRDSILEDAHQNAKEREKRMLQMAHLKGRKAVLSEKQRFINSIFSYAMSHLAGLAPAKYKAIIRHMLLKAVRSGKEEIILSPKDKKLFDPEWLKGINKDLIKVKGIPGELKISSETRPIKGGFILKDGLVEINSSFEAILKYNQNLLESEIADILFGEMR